ncbi:MAG: hypothetical protein QHH01_06760 [Spirochaetales bacterium]|nr:hypothetical protein [Spirochaetales bacterium]
MKVWFMYRDRGFDPGAPAAPNIETMLRDFDLEVLLETMSSGDQFIGTIVRSALFQSLVD